MNPLTNVKNITKLNETELATGLIHKKSWHDMYKDSAWIFIGGIEYGLTEGDVIAVFSQYGEIENINLVRDKKTGKSKGYCFLCYSNQKSTVLAVDNFNGIKLCNRTIRVDHVANYKPPKENERDDEITKMLKSEGCAPEVIQNSETKNYGTSEGKSKKKSKKEKKEKKKKKKKSKHKSASSDSDKETHTSDEIKVKKEKHDPGYDKYDTTTHKMHAANERYEKKQDYTNGECSYSNKNDRLRVNSEYFKTEKNDCFSKYKLKIKTEPDFEHDREYFKTNKNNVPSKYIPKVKSGTDCKNKSDRDRHHTLPKKHKRKRSPSSSLSSSLVGCQSDDNRKKHRLKNETVDSGRYFKQKKKSKELEDRSSSNTDDASSTQTSSEDEKHGDTHTCSKKDKYRIHYESKPKQNDCRDISYHRFEDSYTSSKNKHYDNVDKHAKHKSRTKCKDDKNSHYHKRKSNK